MVLSSSLSLQVRCLRCLDLVLDKFDQGVKNNKVWSATINQQDPNFFPNLAKQQKPQILWFGCADSRVPETTLLNLKPGDVFVHRSVANIVKPWELSQGCVLDYAVEHLEDSVTGEHYVRDIVVCGHTGCGGCAAAFDDTTDQGGPIDGWLLPLRLLKAQLTPQWDMANLSDADRKKELVVENVKVGVKAVKANPHVAKGIKERGLQVHGVIYDLSAGLLAEISPNQL